MARVHLIGASGRTGRVVADLLARQGHEVVAIGRDQAKLAGIEATERRIANALDADAMRSALADGRRIATVLHARFVPRLLRCLPEGIERFVALGSTRAYTRFPDEAAEEVRRAERAMQDRPEAVLLHPTMIYGAAGENNLARLARHLRRTSFVPLPRGGASLIQPVHVDDVARAVVAALFREEAAGPPIVAAGPEPMPYADFVRAVGRAVGVRARIVPAPAGPLMALARMTRFLPGLPTVRPDEVRRLLEDKAFDVEPMRARLGIEPTPFEEGLRRSL
jgi:nucleoside-diphosphate-sugar epimerase